MSYDINNISDDQFPSEIYLHAATRWWAKPVSRVGSKFRRGVHGLNGGGTALNMTSWITQGINSGNIDISPIVNTITGGASGSGLAISSVTGNLITNNGGIFLDATALSSVTHDAVTLGTVPTGVTITGQELSMMLASNDVTYDNTISGLLATDVKSAIDELESMIVPEDQEANEVPYANTTSGLTATDVQAAIDELATTSHLDDDVETVTGTAVDATDPRNPIINLQKIVSDDANNAIIEGSDLGAYLDSTGLAMDLDLTANIMTLKDSAGNTLGTPVDLSLYIDDTNLARIISGTLDASGLATFTRDDASTFTIDFSSFLETPTTLDPITVDSTTDTAVHTVSIQYNNEDGSQVVRTFDIPQVQPEWETVEHFNTDFDPSVTYTGDKEYISVINTLTTDFNIINLAGDDVTVKPNERVNLTFFDGAWYASSTPIAFFETKFECYNQVTVGAPALGAPTDNGSGNPGSQTVSAQGNGVLFPGFFSVFQGFVTAIPATDIITVEAIGLGSVIVGGGPFPPLVIDATGNTISDENYVALSDPTLAPSDLAAVNGLVDHTIGTAPSGYVIRSYTWNPTTQTIGDEYNVITYSDNTQKAFKVSDNTEFDISAGLPTDWVICKEIINVQKEYDITCYEKTVVGGIVGNDVTTRYANGSTLGFASNTLLGNQSATRVVKIDFKDGAGTIVHTQIGGGPYANLTQTVDAGFWVTNSIFVSANPTWEGANNIVLAQVSGTVSSADITEYDYVAGTGGAEGTYTLVQTNNYIGGGSDTLTVVNAGTTTSGGTTKYNVVKTIAADGTIDSFAVDLSDDTLVDITSGIPNDWVVCETSTEQNTTQKDLHYVSLTAGSGVDFDATSTVGGVNTMDISSVANVKDPESLISGDDIVIKNAGLYRLFLSGFQDNDGFNAIIKVNGSIVATTPPFTGNDEFTFTTEILEELSVGDIVTFHDNIGSKTGVRGLSATVQQLPTTESLIINANDIEVSQQVTSGVLVEDRGIVREMSGKITLTSDVQTITLPTPFANTDYSLVATVNTNVARYALTQNLTTNSFTLSAISSGAGTSNGGSGTTISWVAKGLKPQ